MTSPIPCDLYAAIMDADGRHEDDLDNASELLSDEELGSPFKCSGAERFVVNRNVSGGYITRAIKFMREAD